MRWVSASSTDGDAGRVVVPRDMARLAIGLLLCAGVTSPLHGLERHQVAEDEPPPPASETTELAARGAWALTFHGGYMTKEKTGDALVPPTKLETSYAIVALALNRRMMTLVDKIDVELEAQAVKHLGSQTHEEYNGLLVGRWIRFPWNHYLATTAALGVGISYATEIPIFEAITHERASQWLTYALFEITLAPPRTEHWAFVFRAHHRSGANGTFNGVRGGSDALALGFKFRW